MNSGYITVDGALLKNKQELFACMQVLMLIVQCVGSYSFGDFSVGALVRGFF